MRQRKLILFVVLAVLLIGAFATLAVRKREKGEFVQPIRGEIVEAIYGLGKVKARRQFEVKIGILDSVTKLFVREGDTVGPGAPLIKFSDSAVFNSPFAGVVTLVAAQAGESVTPQMPVLRVSDLSDKYVEVALEQQGALRVQKGQKAELVFESLRGEKLSGVVSALFSKNDEFLAHLDVAGLKENILPGMTADIAIIVGTRENALLVPVRSVNNGQVIVLRDGKRMKTPVKIGSVDGQMAEVTGGELRESDQVLVGSSK